MTDNISHVVYIDPNIKGAFYERVLAHELVHVFMFSYNIDIDLDTEEFIADFFSLYGRDMVEVLDMLLENIKMPGQSGSA